MQAAAHGKSSKVPKDVAREFLAATKRKLNQLPERKQ